MTADLTIAGFQPDFAVLAEHIASERAAIYPAKIEAKAMTQADADHRIFVARAIAEIWRCATDVHLRPKPGLLRLTRGEALADLDRAIDIADRRILKAPDDRHRQHERDQLAAMRWWHARYDHPSAYALSMILNLRYDALQLQLRADADRGKAAA